MMMMMMMMRIMKYFHETGKSKGVRSSMSFGEWRAEINEGGSEGVTKFVGTSELWFRTA